MRDFVPVRTFFVDPPRNEGTLSWKKSLRAGVWYTPPAPPFAGRPSRSVALSAHPPMMMAEVGIGACPRPIVGNGREWCRCDDLLDHHRMHNLRTYSDDIGRGNGRHRHHEKSKQRG